MRASVVVVLIACAVAAVVATSVELEDAQANARAAAEFEALSGADVALHIEAARRALVDAKAGACTPKAVKCPNGSTPFATYTKAGTYNGCGAAGSWLDDSILGGKFTPCCNQHDLCYGGKGYAKNGCDSAFYSCMYKLCTGLSTLFCRTQAAAYYQAVSSFGCGAYESARIQNGCPPSTVLRSSAGSGSGAARPATAKRMAAVSEAYDQALKAMRATVPAAAVAAAAAAPVLRTTAPGDAPVEADKLCS